MALTKKQIEQIKARREEQGRKKIRRKKPEKWLFPNPIQRKYKIEMQKQIAELQDLAMDIIAPHLPALVKEVVDLKADSAREDAWSDRLKKLIASVTVAMDKRAPDATKLATAVAADVEKFNKEQFKKVVKSVIAVDVITAEPWLGSKLKSFVSENTKRIKKLPADTLKQVDGMLTEGIRKGHHPARLQRDMTERFQISKRHAEVIARDQVGTLNGQLTELRQKDIGIDKYEWLTAGDERVRSSHAELAGKVFSWSNPPAIGHPGTAIQCRCVASPVMDDLIKEITS